MRYNDFRLVEDAASLRAQIIQRIEGSVDEKLLQRILVALEEGGLTERTQGVLEGDPDGKRFMSHVVTALFNAKGSVDDYEKFIAQYPKGFVNIDKLTSSEYSSWSEVFVGYASDNFVGKIVKSLFQLKNQGIGPGEYMLAILSPQIWHSGSMPGPGDIKVGDNYFEVKAAISKPGRLFDGRKAVIHLDIITDIIRDQLGIEKTRVNIADVKQAGITPDQMFAVARALFTHAPEEYVRAFANAAMGDNAIAIKQAHASMAHMNYKGMIQDKGKDAFSGIIYMDLKGEWTRTVYDPEEYGEDTHVGTIYLLSPDTNDLFAQTSFKGIQ